MQLRSGTVIACPIPTNAVSDSNLRDPTYSPSKISLAKQKVREKVKERQRKIADKHSDKAIDEITETLKMFIDELNKYNCGRDPFMDKMRLVTTMYEYANSISTYVMMQPRLMHLRVIMLDQCKNFSRDAKIQINNRIKAAEEKRYYRSPSASRNFYMSHLNAMCDEFDLFSMTYRNRL